MAPIRKKKFWGVEVKPGEPFVVDLEEHVLHISQASLGEMKKDKGSQSVCLYLKDEDKKLILGTLSHEKFPQISLKLVTERKLELSHSWKHGSVYFVGNTVLTSEDSKDEGYDFEVGEHPPITHNGKSEVEELPPITDNVEELSEVEELPPITDNVEELPPITDNGKSEAKEAKPAKKRGCYPCKFCNLSFHMKIGLRFHTKNRHRETRFGLRSHTNPCNYALL